MTMHDGLMFQNDRFKKQIASIDQSQYQVVHRHQLVESFPIDEGVLAVQELTDMGIVSPAYKIWDVDMEKVVPKYLEFALRAPRSIEYYKSKLRGTTARRRSIPDAEFCAMRIEYPSLNEQKIIVDIIEKAKQVINLRSLELDTLDALIKARFVELFDEKYPEDTLLNLCNIIDYRGKTPEKVEYGLPFITAKNVKMHHMTLEPREYISKETYNKVMVRGFPKEGDVVFTTEAPLGNVCRIPHFDTGFYIGQRIVTMQTDALNPTYLEYALSDEEFVRKYMGKSSGSTVTGIRVRLLEQLTIPVPPRTLQDEFSIFVEQVDKSKFIVIEGKNYEKHI